MSESVVIHVGALRDILQKHINSVTLPGNITSRVEAMHLLTDSQKIVLSLSGPLLGTPPRPL